MAKYRNDNLAYNLDRAYIPDTNISKPLQKPEIYDVKRKAKSILISRATVFMLLICAVVCGLILYCNMILTAYTAQTYDLNEKLKDLKSEEVYLKAQYEKITNLNYIEEYAQKNLGMVKINKNQIEYIDLENPDSIEVVGKSDNIFKSFATSVSTTFTGFMAYFN